MKRLNAVLKFQTGRTELDVPALVEKCSGEILSEGIGY